MLGRSGNQTTPCSIHTGLSHDMELSVHGNQGYPAIHNIASFPGSSPAYVAYVKISMVKIFAVFIFVSRGFI